jgi:hypothetical protein
MLSRLSSFSGPLSPTFRIPIGGFTLNGLILRYEISDRDSYSGSNTVTDLVSNSNATLVSGPTYSINGYINFDGANDYLSTNTSLNSKLSPVNTSLIISHFVWIYPQDNGVIVNESGDTTPNDNFGWHDSQIEIAGGNLKFGLWAIGNALSSLNSSIPTPLYNWYYVGLTYDGSTLRGYVNGQLAGSKSVSRLTPYNNGGPVGLHYGIAAADNTSLGDGTPAKMKLGAFHVYNKALSNQEVVSNYNYTKSNYIYTGSMSIWIDANDPASYISGTSVGDLSGNGYTHSLTSGATSSTIFGFKSFDCTTGSKRITVNGTGPTLSTSGYTYVVWARAISDNSSFRTLLYTKSDRYTPITIPSGTNTLGYWDNEFRSSGYGLTSSVEVWTQYAVVGDNSSQTFYINDSQVGNSISYGAGLSPIGTLHDGLGNNLGTSQSFGHVGNMMLYNKKLTLDEIKQNYDALKHVYANGNFVIDNIKTSLLPSNATSNTTWSTSTGTFSATMTGSPSYNSLGYTFNGINQYGRIPSSAGITDFTNVDSYTVEVWFKPSSGQPNTTTTILEKWNLGNISRYPYVFRYTESTSNVYIAAYDGVRNPVASSNGFSVNNWHQVVGVFNFTTDVMSFYKNGNLSATASLVGVNQVSNTSPVGIAHRISEDGLSAEFMYKGSIGIIRMYSSALSASDVSKNFEANRGLYGI